MISTRYPKYSKAIEVKSPGCNHTWPKQLWDAWHGSHKIYDEFYCVSLGPKLWSSIFLHPVFFFPPGPQAGLFPHVRWLILMNPRRGGEVQLWINMPTQDLNDHTKTCLGCSSMIITEKSCKVQTNDWPRCFLFFCPAEVYCTDVCWQKHQVLRSIFGIGHLGESQLNHSGDAASTLSWEWANDKSMICGWTGIPSVIQHTESIKRVFFTWLSWTFSDPSRCFDVNQNLFGILKDHVTLPQ